MKPPALASWLLLRLIPAEDRQAILGDLEETLHAGRPGYGRTGLRLWYWRQTLGLSVRFLRERMNEGRGARRSPSAASAVAPMRSAGSSFQDLHYAIRGLVRSPGFSLTAVLTLALGIGANTAIFSVVDGILLRPLPLPESERLVALCETNPAIAAFCIGSPPNVEDWDEQARAIEDFGLGRRRPFVITGDEGAEGVSGGIATPGMFNTLRLAPALGRLLQASDLGPGNNHVVVLSHAMWQTRFGGDPTVIGQPIVLDGENYQIVGVLAAGAEVPRLEGVELWAPLDFDPSEHREWRGFLVYGRLAPDATLNGAREGR